MKQATLAFFFLAFPLFAEEAPQPAPQFVDDRPRVRLSLSDCLRMAVDRNLDLEYSRLEPDLFAADLLAFRGAYDPVVYLTSNRRDSTSPTASSLAGADVLKTDAWTTVAGVKGAFPTGTTYDFNFQTDRNSSNSTFSTLNPQWTSSLGFSLRQPLLRQAWLHYNLISARISANSRAGSLARVRIDTQTTLYDVELGYWTLVNAIQQKAVKDRAFQLANRLFQVNQSKVRAGALAPIEELRAESEVASQREGIILAENAIEEAQDALKRLIRPFDLPSDWDFVIVPVDDPAFTPRAVNVADAVTEALANRPELEELRLSRESSKLNESRFRNELLPTVDLTGGLRYAGLGRNMGDSLEGIESSDFDTWELGVIIEYPIGSRAARGGLARAAVETRRAALALRNQEQGIVLEVRSAVREINSTVQRIEATGVASRLALRALEAEQARFERGLTTSHDLLQFQNALSEAESNETKALVDYNVALLKLRKATGTVSVR